MGKGQEDYSKQEPRNNEQTLSRTELRQTETVATETQPGRRHWVNWNGSEQGRFLVKAQTDGGVKTTPDQK